MTIASGKKISARAVVMAIGVSPETSLAKDAGIEIGETGAIRVDKNYKTKTKKRSKRDKLAKNKI